ncbi:hypothetical protein GH5_03445 [Leishmania sp. Ghana 2012 LV757]|uniref:hypothetical protein n=1 Tax=Leishmania sp. Ghana 2012 LV757 TaxID=2803181 RepID=UPI001B628B0B|nr:hypothetical protein GH5_03445 [Leishmania sp. Ghana 2012 LV757]
MYAYAAPSTAANTAIPGQLQPPCPQRGRDFVLPNIPVLDSPEWSEEDNDINLTRTPPRAKAAGGASAPCSGNDSHVISPAMHVRPMARIAPPCVVNRIAPPSVGFNLRFGYEATRISQNCNRKSGDGGVRLPRSAPVGGDTGSSASTCNGDAARKEHATFNGDALGCWLDGADTEEKSDSPPHLSIGSFTVARGGSRFFVPGGRRFVPPAHHFGGDGNESSRSATAGNSSISSDTDCSVVSSDSTDNTSVFRQQRPSMALFSRDPAKAGALLGGDGSPQRPSVPPGGVVVGSSTVVTRPPLHPWQPATDVAGPTGSGTGEAVSAAPSIFCTFFNEDDGSDCMAVFHGDSTSESRRNGPPPPSMTVSGAPALAANASASVFLHGSYGRVTEAANGMATGTHANWGNQAITTASGDGEVEQVPFKCHDRGSFFIAVGEGVHKTRALPAATCSPNAVLLAATDAASTYPMGASQADSCAEAPGRQRHSVAHSGSSNQDTQRDPALPAWWQPSPPENTSAQRSCVYGALADYMLFPQRDAGSVAPSVATGQTTPAINRVVGDGLQQRYAQGSDEESKMQKRRTGVLESVSSRPSIMHALGVMGGGRDDEGSFCSSMVWTKATPLSSTPPAEPTPSSSATLNTERFHFRSRIAPRGHGAAAFAASSGLASAGSQILAVSERSCTGQTGAMTFSLETPYGDGIGATDSAASPDADDGGGSYGDSTVVVDGDEYGLVAWASRSPLRTRPASTLSLGASGGDIGAANEPAGATDSVVVHVATKAAVLPMATQPSSTIQRRMMTSNVRPRRSATPNTAVRVVETAGPFTPGIHHDTPSAITTRALPQSQPSPRTPPHLIMTMPAETIESSRPKSSSIMSQRPTATFSMMPVTARIARCGPPAATVPPLGVIDEPSPGFALGSLAVASSHVTRRNAEYFHCFRRSLAISGASGGEGSTNERVPVSPLPNMPSSANAEWQKMDTDQRRLSSISGGSCIKTSTPPPFRPWPPPLQPVHRQKSREAAPHFTISASSASTAAAATVIFAATPASAPKYVTGNRGGVLATAEDDCELLTIGVDVPKASGGRAGGSVTSDGYTTLSAQSQPVPKNAVAVASGCFANEDLGERGFVHSSGHHSHSVVIVSAEEVQSPRTRPQSPYHRRHRPLLELGRKRRSSLRDKSERWADKALPSAPKGRVGSHHHGSYHGLVPSFSAAARLAHTHHTDSSPPPSLQSTLPRLAKATALHSSECGTRHNVVSRTPEARTPRSSSRASLRLKRLAKCLGL